MISAIVLVSDAAPPGDVAQQREIAVRSLSWLVSAVVSGVVRDVILAAPVSMDLAAIADTVGCGYIVDEHEAQRLSKAGRESRCERILVLRSGFQPIGNLAEEIDVTQCRGAGEGALVLSTPTSFYERMVPSRAAVAGVLTARESIIGVGDKGFAALTRATRTLTRLHTRVQPIR